MKKGLNEIERFCLAGFFITHDADMAYKLSRKQKPCATDDNIHRLALRWVRCDDAKKYLDELAAVNIQKVEKNNNENRDKAAIIRELNTLASSTHDAKLRAELLMRLADLERMKDKESEESKAENLIHYYLPVNYPTSHKDCLLWQNGKCKPPMNENK
jgi:hypothetical protein